jgi:phage terminase large subunit-like protein
MDAIRGFLGRTSEVRGALETESWKVRNPKTDATLQIMSSDEASAWGLRPWLIIVDEFANWRDTPGPNELWRAAFSSLPKVKGSRLVVLTSAGDPAHFSHKIVSDAITADAWRVHQVKGPVPWISDKDLEEQQRLLPEWEFERLHMNRWTASDDKLTNIDDVRAAVTLDGPSDPDPTWQKPKKTYVIGLDVGLKRDRTVATVCHMEDDKVILDRQQTWSGTQENPVQLEEVEAWLLQASKSYNRARVRFDPWQAAHLSQNLEGRGVTVEECRFDASKNGRRAVILHTLLRDRRLAIYEDEDLIDELMNVKLEERNPGVYRIDHQSGKHDDRVISLALCAEWLVSRPTKKRYDPYELSKGLSAANRRLWRLSNSKPR